MRYRIVLEFGLVMRLIRWRMRDSLECSGVRRPSPSLGFPYFARKPSPTGDRGVRSAECDVTRWVTAVSTLGAESRDSSSPPSFPSSPLFLLPFHDLRDFGVRNHYYGFLTGNLWFVSSAHCWYLEVLTRVCFYYWVLGVLNGV